MFGYLDETLSLVFDIELELRYFELGEKITKTQNSGEFEIIGFKIAVNEYMKKLSQSLNQFIRSQIEKIHFSINGDQILTVKE